MFSFLFLLLSALSTGRLPSPEPRTTLFQGRPEVEADLVWPLMDDSGRSLTGHGVLICDVDDPPDIYHPMLFKADRGRFAWIDADGDGTWSPGDGVDINGNGMKDADETLAWLPYTGDRVPGLDRERFQVGYDFLYQDANGNGIRDYGPPAFTESDPCYGEGIFLVDDANGNGQLDTGEELIGLKTSKIRAIFEHRAWRRGVDLIQFPFNPQKTHGTLVAGVLAGGWPGRHVLTGIAPDAELMCATTGTLESLQFAEDEGADVVLWEFAGPFSDGSTAVDIRVDALAASGTLFIAGTGNDRAPARHVIFNRSTAHSVANRDTTRLAIQFFWSGSGPSTIRVRPPGGDSCDVPIHQGFISSPCTGGFIGTTATSPRGFSFVNTEFDAPQNSGVWTFSFPDAPDMVHGYIRYGFSDPGGDWLDGDGRYTVTSPGAADSTITVAAYDNGPPGDIAWFSGEGPRLDGAQVIDIAAPGVRVLSAYPGGARFQEFTGTSAAIPFVAGGAALLRQAFPRLDSGRLRSLLRNGADVDSVVTIPERWGAGKLRIHAALVWGLEHPVFMGAVLPVGVSPNPARGPAEITWPVTPGDAAEVRIFDVRGALVREERVSSSAGHRFDWDGRDATGRAVPSGLYFVHVKIGTAAGVGRCVRVK